jgi:hypothetical protein
MCGVIIIDDHPDRKANRWESKYSESDKVKIYDSWLNVFIPKDFKKIVLATHVFEHKPQNIFDLIIGLYRWLEEYDSIPEDHWLKNEAGKGELFALGESVSKSFDRFAYLLFTGAGDIEEFNQYKDLLRKIDEANEIKKIIKPVGSINDVMKLIDLFLETKDCDSIFKESYDPVLEAKLELLHLCLTPEGAKDKEKINSLMKFIGKGIFDIEIHVKWDGGEEEFKNIDKGIETLGTIKDCFSPKYLAILSTIRNTLQLDKDYVER